MGIHAHWKRGGLSHAKRALITTLICALFVGGLAAFAIYGHPLPFTPVGAALGVWIILSSLLDPIVRITRRQSLSASLVGMTVAHVGLGVFVLGITFVSSNSIERDVAMKPGQVALVGDYAFRYQGVRAITGPNTMPCAAASR